MLIPRHQYFDSGRGNSSFMASITLVNKPLSLPYLNELSKQKRTLLMRLFRPSSCPCIRALILLIFSSWRSCSSLESFNPDGVIAIFGVRFTKSALSYLVSPSPLSITKSHTRRMVRPICFSSGSVFPPGLTQRPESCSWDPLSWITQDNNDVRLSSNHWQGRKGYH